MATLSNQSKNLMRLGDDGCTLSWRKSGRARPALEGAEPGRGALAGACWRTPAGEATTPAGEQLGDGQRNASASSACPPPSSVRDYLISVVLYRTPLVVSGSDI